MAKKVRFPLVMAEDKQARDLTELREYFSLPEVLGYVANGKLVTWLNDRYENDLAEGISALDSTDPDFEKKVCDVLGVEYQDNGTTLEDAQARNEKLAKLKEFSDDKNILDAVDSVAFQQDDIYDLLDEDCKTIYLCGEKFSVPLKVEGITYMGVNKPTVVIASKEVVDFQGKKIVFQGVAFDEAYQKLLEEVAPQKEKTPTKPPAPDLPRGTIGSYQSNSYISTMLSKAQQEESEGCFGKIVDGINEITFDITKESRECADKIRGSLAEIDFDVKADSKNMRDFLHSVGIIGMGESFIENL